jgi:phosphatidylserine decarboxylase
MIYPTDGKVTKSSRGRMHIFMSPLDTHTVYSPVTGRVIRVDRGKRKCSATIKTKGSGNFVVTMGKGILPATIDCELREGQEVKEGEYIGGVYPFGSHVDVTGSFDVVKKGRVESGQSF